MSPKEVRWGILATGGIAKSFTVDLLIDPKTRGVDTLKHTVVAAASSSGASRAQDFLKDCGAPASAKAYGSYDEFVKDPNIDMVYVATPHSHHYQNVMLCLEAGLNVLCEKAFTVNAAQAKALVKKAKEKNLFLMEAVWTRYFPLSIYVRDVVTSGKLGTVTRVIADNSICSYPEQSFADDAHRMINKDLAGGALLDLGIYSLTWCFQTLYHTQSAAERKPPSVVSSLKQYRTGADEMTSIILSFPRSAAAGGDAHAIATTALRNPADPDKKGTAGPAIRIQGDKGEMQVFPPPFRPTRTRMVLSDGTVEDKQWPQPGPGDGFFSGFLSNKNPEGEGHGMFWEADEAAGAFLEGRKEGKFLGLDESIVIMEVMDEVRRQGGLRYPEKIETLDYPVQL